VADCERTRRGNARIHGYGTRLSGPIYEGAAFHFMLLTRKQRAVIQLARAGLGPMQIARAMRGGRATEADRVTVSRLLSRAKRRLQQAGIDPERALSGDDAALLELVA
jgi:DNA-binding NarL/FixJ family response regulator